MSKQATSNLSSALEQEVYAALDEAEIYDISSYGWQGVDDPDPEFIGHAMWQIDQPRFEGYTFSFSALRPVRNRPKEIEKLIITAGEDFCGLMHASRLSIGLALIWHRDDRESLMNIINASQFFWVQHIDTFLKLAVASDRLRDLLIIACTGESPNSYKRTRKNKLYVTPFDEAGDLLANRGFHDSCLSDPLKSLPNFGSAIFDYIKRRNEIVHEISTRMASFMCKRVSELQERFDREQQVESAPIFVRPVEWDQGECFQKAQGELDNALAELRAWYELLVRSSNSVFQIEYWSRVLGQK